MLSTNLTLDLSTDLPVSTVPSASISSTDLTMIDPLQIGSSSSTPVIGTGNGLLGEYYNGKDFNTLQLQRTDATINFDWGNGAPAPSVNSDNFAVRWTGKVQPKYSEVYTFSTTTDDGVRLWIDGQLIIDHWTDQIATQNQGYATLEAGKQYDIRMEYYDRWGKAVSQLMWSSPSQPEEIIPQSQLYANEPFVNGLRGDYFNGMNFDRLQLSRTDATVNFDWGFKAPDPLLDSDHFSVRWTGLVEPKTSGMYTFYTNTDDGVRLWVNGQPLIDNWTNHAPTEDRGTIILQAGQKYDIKLEYFENTNGAVSQLMWSGPDQPKEVIPASQLFSKSIPVLNVKPVVGVPDQQSMPMGTRLAIPGITIADADAGNGQMTVTLNATNGVLMVNGNISNGVPLANIQNNGTGTVVLSGTLPQLTATLNNLTGLIYTSNSNFLGTDTISVSVNDNGNSGAGGAQTDTKAFNVMVYGTSSPGSETAIGVNLNGVTDWSTEWPFVDVFKTSRPWLSQRQGAAFGQGGPLNLTPEGWVASLEPGQFAETVMMTGSQFPAGQYTLLYDGEGKLGFGFDNAKIVSQSPGRMTVDVQPDQTGVFLRILETNPDNPIRNIRFIMPGFENTYQTQPFHPLFLDRLSKFNTLRFMDWGATNNSPLLNWTDRTTINSATQASNQGVALEYMIQLANTLKINPWFNIPAEASDDYVRQFATMVRDQLDPSLRVYIEYSNEVWNNIFSQASYVSQQGLALGLDSNGFTAGLRYYAQRSVEIFKIWEEVFGQSSSQRLVRVLAGQGANPWTAEQILGWKNAYQYADAYAIAPYFDGFGDADQDGWSDLNDVDMVDITLQMTPDQIIDNMLLEIPTEIKQMFDSNYAIVTKRYGLDLLAYEGGSHLTSYQFSADQQAQMHDLFLAVNQSPRMRDLYKAYLDQWQQSGGILFNQFVDVNASTKWGYWGALEYQNQDINTAPKYLGLMDFIQAQSQA